MVLRAQFVTYVSLFALTLFGLLFGAAGVSAQTADLPNAPVIVPAGPVDSSRWYNAAPGSFEWELPPDIRAVAVEMGTSTTHEPMFIYEPPIRRYTPETGDLYEGEQFVAVQFANANGWGAVGYYPVRIDRTPPTDFFVDVVSRSTATSTFVFSANDDLSGIAGYSLHVNGSDPIYLSAEQVEHGLSFRHPTPGRYEVTAIAYDRAGNTAVNRFTAFVLNPSPLRENLWLHTFTGTEMLVGLLGFCLIASLWYIVYARGRYRRIEQRLRSEVRDIERQMGKIFTALRDEIHDQIESLRSKSRMTKSEKNVVENLDRALEVSETLVEKEVTDVKRILK